MAQRRLTMRRGFGVLLASAFAAAGVLLLGPQLGVIFGPDAASPVVEEPAQPTVAELRPALAETGHEVETQSQRVRPVRRPLVPGQIRQLTTDGCCNGAWWSGDSKTLHYLDRPPGSELTAIYGVDVWPPGRAPRIVDTLYSEQAGESPLYVRQDGEYSWVVDTLTGDKWPLPTNGNPVWLSPDGQRAVWAEATGGWSQNDTLVHAYGSDIYGFDVRELGSLWGMHVVGFTGDSERVVVIGRSARNRPLYVMATLHTDTGDMKQLAAGYWLSEAALSTDRSHVIYMVSLDREEPENNGAWVVPIDGGEPRKLDLVGAYRWRDGRRLAYIPMEPGAAHHTVKELDVVTGELRTLVSPMSVPIRVAGNDWSISPDGGSMAFLNEDDRNIWLVDLP